MSTFSSWLSGEIQEIEGFFTSAEAALAKYFGPLFQQILTTAETLGQGDAALGLQVLTNAVTTAVAAGATAAASGADAVSAAESTFVSTLNTQGITAVHNAEAGLIKAGVAIAQSAVVATTQAAADIAATIEPTTSTETAPDANVSNEPAVAQ